MVYYYLLSFNFVEVNGNGSVLILDENTTVFVGVNLNLVSLWFTRREVNWHSW